MSDIMTEIPAAPVVWSVVAAEVLIVVVPLLRRRALSGARVATVAALGLYTAAVLSLTLFPMQVATGRYGNHAAWTSKINPIPLLTLDVHTLVLNILLMVPLGVLVPLFRRGATWRTAGTVGFAASAIIEGVQFTTDVLVSAGRTADVNDLIANTFGALVGYGFVAIACRSRSLRAIEARYALWGSRGGVTVAA